LSRWNHNKGSSASWYGRSYSRSYALNKTVGSIKRAHNQCNRCQCFAETHVICQDAAIRFLLWLMSLVGSNGVAVATYRGLDTSRRSHHTFRTHTGMASSFVSRCQKWRLSSRSAPPVSRLDMKSSASPWCLSPDVSPSRTFVCIYLRHHRSSDGCFVQAHGSSVETMLLRKTIQSHGPFSSIFGLISTELVLLEPNFNVRDIEG